MTKKELTNKINITLKVYNENEITEKTFQISKYNFIGISYSPEDIDNAEYSERNLPENVRLTDGSILEIDFNNLEIGVNVKTQRGFEGFDLYAEELKFESTFEKNAQDLIEELEKGNLQWFSFERGDGFEFDGNLNWKNQRDNDDNRVHFLPDERYELSYGIMRN